MKAVVFGGTTEGRVLSAQLAALGAQVAVSVATELGREEQGVYPGVEVSCGRLTAMQMQPLLAGAAVCIDATHPYALEATANIRAAAQSANVPYMRLLRAQSPLPGGCLVFGTALAAAQALAGTQGNILLTTGAKELGAFAALPPQRLFARVLPTQQAIAACEAAGIPHSNIIAMQGPFAYELNKAIIEQFAIKHVVTKDGGAAGGFEAKARAAQAAGAQFLVLRRPAEQGQTMEQILDYCRGLL